MVVRPDAVQLAAAGAGHRGRVVRISDRNPELLRYLETAGVRLDSSVRVLERKPFGGALVVRVDGREHDVGDEAASAIWVSTD